MPPSDSQTFLRELDKKLWISADKLRSNLDAAVYKPAVLGLIFLKYVWDFFAQRQAEIEAMLKDPENYFFVEKADYDKPCQYDEAILRELEERGYYIERNVFWVPALARWKTLQVSAKLPVGTEITVKNGKTTTYKITTGKLIANHPIPARGPSREEHPRPPLRVLPRPVRLGGGEKGGQYFTSKSIVSLILEMIESYHGRVYGLRRLFCQEYPTKRSALRETMPGIPRPELIGASRLLAALHRSGHGDIMVFGQGKQSHHLAPNGSMALLLANGSMSSNSSGEGDIRVIYYNLSRLSS